MDKSSTSVNQLTHIFHDAILALVPAMDKAGITWKNEQAYDDWDEICSVLYKNILLNAIIFSFGEFKIESIAGYGFVYKHYQNQSFISVECKNSEYEMLAFVEFRTSHIPFDTVKAAILEPKTLNVISYLELNYLDCQFYFVGNENGKFSTISELRLA
jgi:hypothetical protein